jgi:hypothetical protein
MTWFLLVWGNRLELFDKPEFSAKKGLCQKAGPVRSVISRWTPYHVFPNQAVC